MISRLTTLAATFAILATASLAFAASSHFPPVAAPAAKPMKIVQLERVVITVRHTQEAAR